MKRFIKTLDGRYVNVDYVRALRVRKEQDKWCLTAVYNYEVDAFSWTVNIFDTKEEAQKYLDELVKELEG